MSALSVAGMNSWSPVEVWSPFQNGFARLTVVSVAWLLTVQTAACLAAFPFGSEIKDAEDLAWRFAFAWLHHLVLTGIAVIGFGFAAVHAWCLSTLMNGTTSVASGLRVAFLNQLMASAVAHLLVEDGDWRAWLELAVAVGLAIAMFVIRHLASRPDST